MNPAITEIKKSPSYRYIKQLVQTFEAAGIEGDPMEIPIEAVLKAPLPDYMPVAAATKCKVLFILAVYQNRMGGLMDAVPGVCNTIQLVMEEK